MGVPSCIPCDYSTPCYHCRMGMCCLPFSVLLISTNLDRGLFCQLSDTLCSSLTVSREFERQAISKRNGLDSSFSPLSRSLERPSSPFSSSSGSFSSRKMKHLLPNSQMGARLTCRFNLRCFGCRCLSSLPGGLISHSSCYSVRVFRS